MQAREYRINWEIYTPYAGAAGMLLLRNGKFTIGKLKSTISCLVNDTKMPKCKLSYNTRSFIDQDMIDNYLRTFRMR